MDAKDVRKRLDDALREVLESDRHLFETDASERSIAARLECAGYRNESDQSLAVPDVIVHRRGPTGPNLTTPDPPARNIGSRRNEPRRFALAEGGKKGVFFG